MLMFVPGLMAAFFRVMRREGFKTVGWGMGQPLYWFWAVVLPVTALAVAVAISIGLGYTRTGPDPSAPIAAMPATRIVIRALFYFVIALPLSFGEEFGWRGYAQPRLTSEFGLLPGLLLLGLLWGFWHAPIFYFMGTYPEHPILGPFVMTPIDNILAVVPMGWLYVRSRSIWVPTFTHAFADILWGFSGLLFPPNNEIYSWAVLQVAQLTLSIVLLLHWRGAQKGVGSPDSVICGER